MLLLMPSRWCAWCGKLVVVGVVIAGVVVYHLTCWERRARVIGISPRRSNRA